MPQGTPNPVRPPRPPVESFVQSRLAHREPRSEFDRRCVGKNGNYDPPCNVAALVGQRRCRVHGGDTYESRVKQVMDAVVKFGGKMDVTPGEALLDLVQHKAAETHYWRAKVMDIEDLIGPAELGGMMEVGRKDSTGNFGPTEETTYAVVVHVWYRLLRDCERDLLTYCAAAMRAGVEERAVRVAESLGMQMLSAIEEIMNALALTPAQQVVAGQVVPKVIRGLSQPANG